jgi:DNA repair exonuclease SbcCD ATPase subunit
MHGSRRFLAIAIVTVLTVPALAGCSQSTTTGGGGTTKPAVDKQQLQQKAASANEALKQAQAKVNELAAGLAALDAKTTGLQINAKIKNISTKLDTAIQETADKKQAAIAEVTTALNDLIANVDAAAAKLPAGGPVRTKLEAFSAKLRDVQTNLTAVAASMNASSTP